MTDSNKVTFNPQEAQSNAATSLRFITSNDLFIEQCQRTLSGEFFAENVSANAVLKCAEMLAFYGGALDKIKKSLFYGKQNLELAPHQTEPNVNLVFTHLNKDIVHGIIGKVTESIELLEALMNAAQTGLPLDLVNIKEEVGDGLWYDAIIAKAACFTFEQAQQAVIAKLQKRYPEKFTCELAEKRNLEAERDALENN